MQLIPVIDLKGGCVVHARRGLREAYRPIATPLARSAAPLDVVAGLLALAPFRTLYVADLDAISGTGCHVREVDALRHTFPQLELWIDAGESRAEQVRQRADDGRGISVVGSESLPDEQTARAVLAARPLVLSLDSDTAGPRGPRTVHEQAGLWPERVIIMTLSRVGSGEGPDLDAFRAVADRARLMATPPALFAAGGVRGTHDLAALSQEGAAGVLVASALHDGRIDAAAARRWA